MGWSSIKDAFKGTVEDVGGAFDSAVGVIDKTVEALGAVAEGDFSEAWDHFYHGAVQGEFETLLAHTAKLGATAATGFVGRAIAGEDTFDQLGEIVDEYGVEVAAVVVGGAYLGPSLMGTTATGGTTGGLTASKGLLSGVGASEVGLGLQAAGGAFKAYGQYKKGEADANYYKDMADKVLRDSRQKSKQTLDVNRLKRGEASHVLAGTQLAAGGVQKGSGFSFLLEQSKLQASQASQDILRAGDEQASLYRQRAEDAKSEGKRAMFGEGLSTGGSLISTLSKAGAK